MEIFNRVMEGLDEAVQHSSDNNKTWKVADIKEALKTGIENKNVKQALEKLIQVPNLDNMNYDKQNEMFNQYLSEIKNAGSK